MRANSVLRDILKCSFKPKEHIPADEWVERYIRLDSKTSNLAGRYSLRHTPYLRQIYQDISNPRIRKIAVKKGAQLGLTQLGANTTLYYVSNHNFPCLTIMPSKESAQQFCERSLIPSIHNSDEVRKFLTGNPDDIKKTEMLFNSCIVRVIGAGSPSKLASNPACLIIIDEADKMEDFASQGEAPALELAEDRALSFPNDKKILILSTPTIEASSVIEAEYKKGSQSKYFVRCPHCGKEQILTFGQVKWPEDCKNEEGEYDLDRVEREAWYECENEECKAHLNEVDKIEMVRAGCWKDTNPNPFPAEVRSYHISALYSFNITWGGLAKIFLMARKDPGKLRNFNNSFLGECHQEQATTITNAVIEKLIAESPKYQKGELPEKPLCILGAVDVQGDHFYYSLEAVYKNHSAVIDWGKVSGWSDLTAMSHLKFRVKGTEEDIGIYSILIDAGYNTNEVKKFCFQSGRKFLPCLGRDSNQVSMRENADLREDEFEGNKIFKLIVNDNVFKDQLYISTFKERTRILYLPQNTDAEYKKQISSEHLAVKRNKKTGKKEMAWVCSNGMNHYGDTLKYIEALKYELAGRLQIAAQEDERRKEAEEKKRREETELLGAAPVQPQTPRPYVLNRNAYIHNSYNSWD